MGVCLFGLGAISSVVARSDHDAAQSSKASTFSSLCMTGWPECNPDYKPSRYVQAPIKKAVCDVEHIFDVDAGGYLIEIPMDSNWRHSFYSGAGKVVVDFVNETAQWYTEKLPIKVLLNNGNGTAYYLNRPGVEPRIHFFKIYNSTFGSSGLHRLAITHKSGFG